MLHLAHKCLRHSPEVGLNHTAIRWLKVYRQDQCSELCSAVYTRSLFLVTQGRKVAYVGDERYFYDPEQYLLTSVPLPVVSQILEASPARPFLSLIITFEMEDVREIMLHAGDILAPGASEEPQRGLASSPVTEGIAGGVCRLLSLLDQPEDIRVLAPLYRRELLYLALKGPRGGFLRAAAMGHGLQQMIADVLSLIHRDYSQSFTVSDLSARAGMSESAFYEAFRTVTANTPMQYIKRLRLQEAHRQLTLGLNNVSGAAFGVGYNSLSQFSREFTRVFGSNPSTFLPR